MSLLDDIRRFWRAVDAKLDGDVAVELLKQQVCARVTVGRAHVAVRRAGVA